MANISFSRNFEGVADVLLRWKLYKPLLEFIENVVVGESTHPKEELEISQHTFHASTAAIAAWKLIARRSLPWAWTKRWCQRNGINGQAKD